MTSKKLALLSGAACIVVLVAYAWAVSHEKKQTNLEAAAEQVKKEAEVKADPVKDVVKESAKTE